MTLAPTGSTLTFGENEGTRKKTIMFKTISLTLFCLAFFGGHIPDLRAVTRSVDGFPCNANCQRTAHPAAAPAGDCQADIDRLIALRSHPWDELLALANQLEIKWRRINWDQYAQIMIYVCSEIANHGLNDVRVRTETKHFAAVALSHSRMFKWEYQSSLVGWFSDQRWSPNDSDWLRERRENAVLWLQTWQRLEKEFDPTFDINDRKNRPLMRVFPPDDTHLPAGSPPSAIKDPKLRAQYEAALELNKRKSERVDQQFPLLAHGPAFKARAEHVLISLYSQPPFKNAELKRFLEAYVHDDSARQRILDQVQKASN